MISKDELLDILDSNDFDPIEFLNKNFNNCSAQLLEILMGQVLSLDEVNIGTYTDLGKKGSLISFDNYNIERELFLKMDSNSKLHLEVNITDWDGNLHRYSHGLESNELELIPIGLITLMKQVLSSHESIVVSRNNIKN